MTTRPALLLAVILGLSACRRPQMIAVDSNAAPMYQAISLLGDTLSWLPMSDSARAGAERQLAAAYDAYRRAPTTPDSIIWYARRLAYLGKFRQAIAVYTRGIELHPQNPWMYRHRGHRYITVRELDRAIADLERAAQLVQGKPDEVEPDGQPNEQNIPIGTLHSNIDYHLALAYYLKGDFARAIPVYQRELADARNDDRRVSIAYWYVLALKRLKRNADAEAVLNAIPRDLHIIENGTYHDLLRVFRGELRPDSVLAAVEARGGISTVGYVTTAYGVATWYLLNSRETYAKSIYSRIVSGSQWPAFGYIAAEAELARDRPVMLR